ncbi:facilitated trehalose transporter Tret1-2 homolog isoform X1 [Penaeus chinensis]|uniref:facilitated trehalose transporter Tret1-2 homolog isoform X1 n=1 Tax=Penaeus chinensis TaxID=139456 RepID=UPI001FB5EFD9|nr:facilitated trehalose transporter Tret1-2 homolog isoform X1 [Penaeus chinensis]XP_047497927.1 facilitated trehalose transporter Tret1-2 homolog isoform X1 [Penaeus chinensis]XP_047497928.1 facilitated trehalose transporter Tret1-2 homolog isoform X1 [Penaeus chinensis]XP_047497929.1 facilitated trehalose transporter Tret1-2 homolog isoform X1 [Penaeus chinensis]XP_047497930.1 facilitated trehalose transporter Tret1-2 homolog isoform X1 [Penaeus chinensis]
MMTEEDRLDEAEVTVVLPDRTVPVENQALSNESPTLQGGLSHKFELFAACVMGLSTLSGGFLEGYTSPAIPTLLQNSTFAETGFTDDTEEETSELTTILPDVESTTIADWIEENTTLVKRDVMNANSTLMPDVEVEVRKLFTELHLTEEEASWLGSLLLLGACLGALVSSWVIGLGRRRAVCASALPRFIGWIMISAASDVYMMYGGRFLTGVSIGIVTSAVPVYISEVAHSSVRGALSCIVQIGVNIGIFTAAFLGTFMEWRGLAVFGAVTVVIYFGFTLFIPDSPVWLIMCGRDDDARQSLRKLRGRKYCVEYELQQIISAKANQYNQYSWREVVTQRSCVLPLAVVGLVTVVNRCSGYNAIITYCATFLHQAVPAVSEYWAAAVVTLMQVVSTLGAAVLVDRLGRRKLLLGSILAMAIALATIAICEIATSHGAGNSWVAVLATIFYVSAYSIGVGPITWVLVGELFPQAARDKASAIIAVLNWFLAFIITKTYFRLEAVTGIAGTCFVYSSVCVVGLVLCYLVVPETKERTLGEIEAYFTYSKLSWKSTKNRRDVALSSILEQEGGIVDTYSTFENVD